MDGLPDIPKDASEEVVFTHSPDVSLRNRRYCQSVLHAIDNLLAHDRNHGVFSKQTVASSAGAVHESSGKKPTLSFDLGHHALLGLAQELGCKHAFFVPSRSLHPYIANEPIPYPVPSDWIPLGLDINPGHRDGSYLIRVSEELNGVVGATGVVVLRPNTGNEILRDNFKALHDSPEKFPLSAAVASLDLDEKSIIVPVPPYPGRGLTEEQARCVAHYLRNPVTMIWGPPGTGKSVTLCGILTAALSQNLRVLVLATANDSIVEKVYKIHLSGKDPIISGLVDSQRITRYGYSRRIVNYPDLSFSYREKTARARKKSPGTALESMKNDAVTFSTFFRFLHLNPGDYDVVVIDEVGFVNIPTIYAAAATATKKVVLCGDPRQAKPIFTYKTHDVGLETERIFTDDIFRHNKLRIEVGDRADARLCMLTTQYRMDDRIAEAVRLTNLYPRYSSPQEGRTITTSEKVALGCFPAPGEALVILDTGLLRPYSSENYNQKHFEIIKLLASEALARTNIGHVGIVTPYKKQALSYHRWITEHKIARCRVGTVHKFQGSECPIVFFDTVESTSMGAKPASHYFTDDIKYGTDTINNLNVAVSRAKAKLVVVMDVAYVQNNLSKGCYLHRLVSHAGALGNIVPAEVLLSVMGRQLGEQTSDHAYFSKRPDVVAGDHLISVFKNDISIARHSIDILSRNFDRLFFDRLLETLKPVCKHRGIVANFYIGHRLSAQDKAFLDRAVDQIPYFTRIKHSEWKHGPSTYIVIDNRVFYESGITDETSFLNKEIPGQSTRFVFPAHSRAK